MFTREEVAYCRARKNSAQHFAVRFAAKEAVWKAIGDRKLSHRSIQVRNRSDGKPEVFFPCGIPKIIAPRFPFPYLTAVSMLWPWPCSTKRYAASFYPPRKLKKMLPRHRPLDSHKGLYGHVLVIAGSRGMSGAAALVARGALRAGAGLATVAMPASEVAGVTHQLPEALTLALPETPEGAISEHAVTPLETYLKKRSITTLAIGPGLSVASSVEYVLKRILKEWEQPLVLDADGLNNLKSDDLVDYPNLVITPHPAELARLFWEWKPQRFRSDRPRVAESIAHDDHLICILKGHHTVVTDGKTTRINPTGTPAMAAGGAGDILTGIVRSDCWPRDWPLCRLRRQAFFCMAWRVSWLVYRTAGCWPMKSQKRYREHIPK